MADSAFNDVFGGCQPLVLSAGQKIQKPITEIGGKEPAGVEPMDAATSLPTEA